MTVKEVLTKYHKIIPFPVSIKKIRKAGLSVRKFLFQLADELKDCDDIDTKRGREFLAAINEIKKSLN